MSDTMPSTTSNTTSREAQQLALESFLMNGAFARAEIEQMKSVPLDQRPDYTLENMAIVAEEVVRRAGITPRVRIEKGVAGTGYRKVSVYPMTFGNLTIVEKKRRKKDPEKRNIAVIRLLRPVADEQGRFTGKQVESLWQRKPKEPMFYRVQQTLKEGTGAKRTRVLDVEEAAKGLFFHDHRGIAGTFKYFERFICDAQEMSAPGDFNKAMIRVAPRRPKPVLA